jgi:NodT family efflux transporter outer membrane factor (OMF) lipoprotein
VLKSRATTFSGNFNISWELDLWGRIRSGRGAARTDLRSVEADVAAARQSLAARIAGAWIIMIESRRQLELANATAENFASVARQVRQRYERGIRSPLDVRLSESNEAGARALAAGRESHYQASARRLELLVGRYPSAELKAADTWPDLSAAVPAGLPSDLLDRRPDLIAAEHRLSSAHLRVREAKAALFPRLSLTASGGRTSAELEDLLSSQFNIWSLAANLVQPLLQGGRLRGNVRLHEARAREALESYLETALRAFGEVETALADETLLRQQERALADAARQSIAARDLAENRYHSGLETFVTLLEAQRRAFETESQWLTVRRLRIDNRIELHLALGGGFAPAAPSATRSH